MPLIVHKIHLSYRCISYRDQNRSLYQAVAMYKFGHFNTEVYGDELCIADSLKCPPQELQFLSLLHWCHLFCPTGHHLVASRWLRPSFLHFLWSWQSLIWHEKQKTVLKENKTGQFSTTRPKQESKESRLHTSKRTSSKLQPHGCHGVVCLLKWEVTQIRPVLSFFSLALKTSLMRNQILQPQLNALRLGHIVWITQRNSVYPTEKSSKTSYVINSIKGVIISVKAGECDARRCCGVCGVLACSLRVSPLRWRFLDTLFIQALRNLTTHTVAMASDKQKKTKQNWRRVYIKKKLKKRTNQREDTTPQKEGSTGRSELRQKSKWKVSWGHPGQFLPWLVDISVSPQSRTWN